MELYESDLSLIRLGYVWLYFGAITKYLFTYIWTSKLFFFFFFRPPGCLFWIHTIQTATPALFSRCNLNLTAFYLFSRCTRLPTLLRDHAARSENVNKPRTGAPSLPYLTSVSCTIVKMLRDTILSSKHTKSLCCVSAPQLAVRLSFSLSATLFSL